MGSKSNKTKVFFISLLLSFSLLVVSVSAATQNEYENEEDDDEVPVLLHRSQFPQNFFFGTATSSYQIEGAYLQDGKGLSNWDVFTHIPGKINNNDNGDVADDHYHRFTEDIDLMHSMGLNAYRFSLSWARILPKGRFGRVNRRGITFYNKIINHLLLRGIEPFVTIHHHDLPYELDQRYGSWLSPKMQEDFVYYAKVCFEEFGDRVKHWFTINEPNLVTNFAFTIGVYPPARCSLPFGNCSSGNSDLDPLIVMHNMLLAHAKAVQLYRNYFQAKQGGSIGLVPVARMYEPLRDNQEDREAVNRGLAFNLAWVYDPIVYGDYPNEMRQILGNQLPRFSDEEKKILKGSLDFIAITHYISLYVMDCLYSACPDTDNRSINGFIHSTPFRDGIPIGDPTGMPNFFVVPRGMEKTINYINQRYPNIPIIVAENGYSLPKGQEENVENIVNDVNRIKYHKGYLASLAKAMRNGGDVRGYFIWSLMDNFEWNSGYEKKFGLFYVNRSHSTITTTTTLKRIPKLSSKWFAAFLANNTTPKLHDDDDDDDFHYSKLATF